jgi:hypothetical protein
MSLSGTNTYKKLDGGISSFTDGQIQIENGEITGVSYLEVDDVLVNSSLSAPEITDLQTGNAVAHSLIDALKLGNLSLNTEVDSLSLGNTTAHSLVDALKLGNLSLNNKVTDLYNSNITINNKIQYIDTSSFLTTISSNLFVNGNLYVSGNIYDVDTETIITDAMKIINDGTAPSLLVNQKNTSLQNIVEFKDDDVDIFTIGAGGYISNNPTVTSLETSTQYLSANVSGTFINGNIKIDGNANIYGNCFVSGNLKVNKDFRLLANAYLNNHVNIVGNVGVDGNLEIGSLNFQPNKKANLDLNNCLTIGNQTTNTVQNVPNFTFTSNSQSGYTVASSSIGRYSYAAYLAFVSGGTGWWSNQNSYQAGGSPSGTYYLTYGPSDSVSNGDWVSISCPNYYLLRTVSFYNDDGYLLNHTMVSVAVFGQYDSGTIFLLGTYSMGGNPPSKGTYSFNITTTSAYNKFYFQCTQCSNWSGGGVSFECAVSSIVFTGEFVSSTISQNIYIPQSLEIGRSLLQTLNTANALTVNGDTNLIGDLNVLSTVKLLNTLTVLKTASFNTIQMGDFASWTPTSGSTYSLPAKNIHTDYDSAKGYYIFPGGFCIQWGFSVDASTNTWSFAKTLTYIYGVFAEHTNYYAGGGGGASVVLTGMTTSSVSFDSNYGGTDKTSLFVLVLGKV